MVGQEEKVERSSKAGNFLELDDVKYISGLSTILVATIQEAKDRISQIEYIFCSQLFPNFQSMTRSLQAIHAEALQSAERVWKEKEDNQMHQIEKMRIDKEQLVQENQSVRVRMEQLERDLGQKIKEVDDGMVLQQKLIQLVQSSESNLASKVKQLKEQQEAASVLQLRQSSVEKSVEGLKEELRHKNVEIAKVKQLEANLLKKMEVQALEIFSKEQLLLDCEKEKEQMKVKLKYMEERIGRLEEELQEKSEVGEEARSLGKNLIQENDFDDRTEKADGTMQSMQDEEEQKKLLHQVNDLEGRVNDLLALLDQKSCEASKVEERLQQQLHSTNSELSSEKKKRADLVNMYKSLKSQYNYLLKKYSQSKSGCQDDRHEENLVTTPNLEKKSTATVNYAAKVKDELDVDDPVENEKDGSLPNSSSPSSGGFVATKSVTSKKSSPASGSKRRASGWRDTRSHQSRCGPDPHDDFLDTPLENFRRNLNDAENDKLKNPSNREQKGVDCNSLDDDETEDMNVDLLSDKREVPAPSDGSRKSFKFVSTVRKKAERETLKGVECKQCKKFYDAVLPENNGTTDADGNRTNFRCEHHDGVSRHRYKYAPPLTPEGFWNIGFESEM